MSVYSAIKAISERLERSDTPVFMMAPTIEAFKAKHNLQPILGHSFYDFVTEISKMDNFIVDFYIERQTLEIRSNIAQRAIKKPPMTDEAREELVAMTEGNLRVWMNEEALGIFAEKHNVYPSQIYWELLNDKRIIVDLTQFKDGKLVGIEFSNVNFDILRRTP